MIAIDLEVLESAGLVAVIFPAHGTRILLSPDEATALADRLHKAAQEIRDL